MTQDEMREKHRQDTVAFDNAQGLVAAYTCGECENLLVVKYMNDNWIAVCGTNDSHVGWRKEETAVDVYRGGGAVEPYIKTHIERTRPPVRSVEVMKGIFQSRQARLTDAGAYQAALFAMQIGLDPRFGEIAVIEFGSRDSPIKTPAVMITEDGWGRLAARELPHLYDRRPVIMMVTDTEECSLAGAKPGDYVAKAAGRLMGDKDLDLPVRVSYGIYKATESQGERANPVAKAWPMNQARVRAARHWFEENCDGAVERAREAWSSTIASMDLEGMDTVIEAEFSVVDAPAAIEPPKPVAKSATADRPVRQQREGRPTLGEPQGFANLGDLLNYYRENFGMDRHQVEEVTGSLLPSSDLQEAQAKLKKALEPDPAADAGSDLFPPQ